MTTLHHAAISIQGAAVGEFDAGRVLARLPRRGIKLEDPVIRNVAPAKRLRGGYPDRPFSPDTAGEKPFQAPGYQVVLFASPIRHAQRPIRQPIWAGQAFMTTSRPA